MDSYFRRLWKIAICRMKYEYPICWKLFGQKAIERVLKCPKKYWTEVGKEFEALDNAIFMIRPINKKLKKGD